MSENDITGDVLDAAIKIHRRFGPGMLESIYEQLLEAELARRGHKVERQKSVSFEYDGLLLENAFRVDLLIDDVIVVELKATEQMKPVFAKQVKTYLVAMNLQVGVVINFGMATIKEGFTRVVNGFKDNNSQRLCLSASLRETDSSQESVI
jgi:iron complex transport system substrate-binding protein